MSKQLTPATSEELTLLADPSALNLLKLLSRNHWLALDVKELEQFLGHADHPARAVLAEDARSGGKYGAHLAALTLIFLGVILFFTSFTGLQNPVIFWMWAALGVAFGLLLGRYPAILDKLRKGKQA